MQLKTNENLEALLDNNSYDDSQLMELKIPVHLPYQNRWTTFERYNGEIEIEGVMYKYVKRKLANDTLYLMCIPNIKKMRLETAKNDFFKIANDLMQNNSSKESGNPHQFTSIFKLFIMNLSFGINIISPFDSRQNCWLPLKIKNLLSASSYFSRTTSRIY